MKVYVVLLDGEYVEAYEHRENAHAYAGFLVGAHPNADVEVRLFTDDHLNVQKKHGERVEAKQAQYFPTPVTVRHDGK